MLTILSSPEICSTPSIFFGVGLILIFSLTESANKRLLNSNWGLPLINLP